MKTVLAAGANGILGKVVSRLLHEKGYRVRSFSRNPARAQALRGIADEIATGDATKPKTIERVLNGVDAVISCLGAPMGFTGKDRRSFRDVDTIANCNLIQAAKKAGVSRFVYVSVHTQPGYARTAYIRAHEEVIAELRKSGISFGVVSPTGMFPIFDPLLEMARRGILYIPGNGKALTNPVHPLDVAEACIGALDVSNDLSVSVGGPDILSREEIARMAFKAVGKKPKIVRIPRYVLLASAAMVQPFHPRYAEVLEFVAHVFTSECVAPTRGTRRLFDHFAEVASISG
jgi:uncharacterized protein YbjT (DUF2867 family)